MNAPEVSRRERKKDETRERISSSALELFREKGFEATTIDEIAVRADVGKGTFFNYFPRKEAVLNALTERQLEDVEALAEGMKDDPRPVREKLLAIFSQGCAVYSQNPALHRHAIIEMLRGPLSDAVNIDTRAQAFVRGLVEQGQQRGELRPDVDPDRMAYTLRSVFFMTVLVWVHRPEMFDLTAEVQSRMQLVLEGIGTGGAR